MKFKLLLAAVLTVATPASAGFQFVTVDGPASPGRLGTVVTGINNLGVAAGYRVDASPPASPGAPPYTYSGFTVNADGTGYTAFDRAGYDQTGVGGINDAGYTVGVSVLTYGQGNAFIRDPFGNFTDLDPNGQNGITAAYSEAIGINNSGTIVGFYTETIPPTLDDIPAYSHGFILSGGVYTQLDHPGGTATQLFAVNDLGFISGASLDAMGNATGFVYVPGLGFMDVPPVPGFNSSVGGVNNLLHIAYTYQVPTPLSPTGYVPISLVDLGSRGTVLVAKSGAFATEVLGINDLDQITGYYIDDDGIHGFVASYVPEPAAWLMMIFGFGLAGAMVRRRRYAGPAEGRRSA